MTPQGTLQNDKMTQHERFEQLMSPLLAQVSGSFSVCDVGSGIADLHHFLVAKGVEHNYTGIEVVQEMVDAVLAETPSIRLLNEDILAEQFVEEFDFLVASGTFNLPAETPYSVWEPFVYSMIEKMFGLARIGISFNGLTTFSTFRQPDLHYMDPVVVLDFIQRRLGRYCEVRMASPLYEVTYTVFKSEHVQQKYTQAEFRKYFA